MKFEYIGGRMWSVLGKNGGEYDESIITVEIERGKQPFIVSLIPHLVTKELMDEMFGIIHKELYEN